MQGKPNSTNKLMKFQMEETKAEEEEAEVEEVEVEEEATLEIKTMISKLMTLILNVKHISNSYRF